MAAQPHALADAARRSFLDIEDNPSESQSLSAFALVIEEIKKTPKESLPDLLELIIKFNEEYGG